MSKAYSTNLTQAQWELLEPLIPPAKTGGRPREVEVWEVLNAIFYVLCEGCRWRNLPGDFPQWQTVYTYFRNWRKDGTWVKMHDRLRTWTRVANNREPSPSEAVVDSQSVKSAAMVSQAVGYDAAKQVKGRKRHLTVDTLGLVLRVLVTAASVPEREGGKQLLKKVKKMAAAVSRLHTVWVDGGYDGGPFMHARDGHLPLDCPGSAATAGSQGLCLATQTLGGRTDTRLVELVSAVEQRL